MADDIHYPGTYLAGGYNRLQTVLAGHTVENEDLVNFPNWLMLEFRIADQEWFDVRRATLLSYRQELDLRHGMLSSSAIPRKHRLLLGHDIIWGCAETVSDTKRKPHLDATSDDSLRNTEPGGASLANGSPAMRSLSRGAE